MCPLRFILVFFSALLAAYFAWKTVRSSPEFEITCADSPKKDKSSSKNQDSTLKQTMEKGFWVLVEMASGKYLWRNLRAMNRDIEVKSS